ncbi:MAG: hypothetical protein SV377_03635, partial [Halobacteria archaeon]|nr:hypothetical protein [Halobacteria archaeon]
MDDVDIDDLKEETERTDRLGEEESDSEEDELDINYRSFDDVVRTQAPGDDIIDLKNQTRRTTRLEERDETVDLDPFEELDLEGEPFNEVDDHYCGNCVHVKFRKSTGRPQV